MLSRQKSVIISEDEDDYELPSLSERIASFMSKDRSISHPVFPDSEDGNSNFQNSLKKRNPPPLNIKLDFSATSDSEDEESTSINISQQIQSSPQLKALSCVVSESDSDDEMFSNLTKKLSMMTPRTENKENCEIGVGSYSTKHNLLVAEKMSEFRTPLPPQKEVSCKVVDSESDESFSNFVETLRTPLSVKRNVTHKALDSESDESFSNFVETLRTPLSVNRTISCKAVDSESDDSFSNFVERLRTPLSEIKKNQKKENETDSDDSFLNNSRKQMFQTPRSQLKKQVFQIPKSQYKSQKDVSLSNIIEKEQHQSPLLAENTPNLLRTCKSENEREFRTLFHPESISSTFLRKRESYTRMLYEFYNRKVFTSQLPANMPLIYNGALKTTAGMTCCSVKDGVYLCSIKLSSSLLSSFDHLRDTLLHEMCHAAVWVINKQHKVRHGPLWQQWASRCKMILPFIECPTRCHNFEISYNVWYQCPKCQWKAGRCKQVKKYHGALCKRCHTPIIMTHA